MSLQGNNTGDQMMIACITLLESPSILQRSIPNNLGKASRIMPRAQGCAFIAQGTSITPDA